MTNRVISSIYHMFNNSHNIHKGLAKPFGRSLKMVVDRKLMDNVGIGIHNPHQ